MEICLYCLSVCECTFSRIFTRLFKAYVSVVVGWWRTASSMSFATMYYLKCWLLPELSQVQWKSGKEIHLKWRAKRKVLNRRVLNKAYSDLSFIPKSLLSSIDYSLENHGRAWNKSMSLAESPFACISWSRGDSCSFIHTHDMTFIVAVCTWKLPSPIKCDESTKHNLAKLQASSNSPKHFAQSKVLNIPYMWCML